ncbi:MAG: glycosyltransferase [Clostridiales bacterium]|nr:glycosyltransferase [Clostridiales bacterium]
MIKVLFLIPTLAHGGAEKVLVNLANNINKQEFDVTVQTLFDVGENKQFLSPDVRYIPGYKKLIKGNSKIMKLFSPRVLYKYFIKDSYDIIVSYLEGPTARIVSGCTDNNTKLVSWIHCTYKDIKDAAASFRSVKEMLFCYDRFDITACVSNSVKESFVKTLNFDKPITTIYNTIETDLITQKSNDPVVDIKFDKDCFNICSVGKIIPVKAFDRLARIHRRLLDEGIKNHVYIFGVGSGKAELESLIDSLRIKDTFTLAGYRDNPYKYVKACDLSVCSSLSEGLSTAVTEALIVGTPVVTTLCSGMKELLGENNEYGIVTDNNEEALYNGIKQILTADGMLEHYGKKALERAPYFSTENTVRSACEMFKALINKR